MLYVSVGGLTNVAVANASGCLFTRAAAGGLDAMVHTLSERRGLTLEHARQWMTHVGLHAPLEDDRGRPRPDGRVRTVLEEGVHQLADTVRNSLNFYRMQESAEQVETGVLTGPAVAIPGFVEPLSEQLRAAARVRRGRRRTRTPTSAASPSRPASRSRTPSSDARSGRRRGLRLVPERGGLPAAAGRVAVAPAIALPAVPDPDQGLRQRPGPVLAGTARPLPYLPGAPISARYPLVEALTASCARSWSSMTRASTRTRSSASSWCCRWSRSR